MNKDKAIQLLERLQDPEPYEPMLTKDAYDAIQMAIDALSADGDTISRKAAIEALDEIETEVADGYGYQYAKWREYFAELPSAQPKMGEWIHHPEIGWGEMWMCNQCGEKTISTVMGKPRYNFCPMCGSYNGGEKDDSV